MYIIILSYHIIYYIYIMFILLLFSFLCSVGASSTPIWLDDLSCSSGDRCLSDCQRCPGSSDNHNCFHSEDVTITCSEYKGRRREEKRERVEEE